MAGYNMIRGVFADTAKVIHFDEAYNLTQKEVRGQDNDFCAFKTFTRLLWTSLNKIKNNPNLRS